MKWKILVITTKGTFFASENSLIEPFLSADTKWFDSYDDAVNRSKDIVCLNLEGVTQIRIISDAF